MENKHKFLGQFDVATKSKCVILSSSNSFFAVYYKSVGLWPIECLQIWVLHRKFEALVSRGIHGILFIPQTASAGS